MLAARAATTKLFQLVLAPGGEFPGAIDQGRARRARARVPARGRLLLGGTLTPEPLLLNQHRDILGGGLALSTRNQGRRERQKEAYVDNQRVCHRG